MTYTIKASEVKLGMEVEIVTTKKMVVHRKTRWGDDLQGLEDDWGNIAWLDTNAPVTVVSEPEPVQPEEPRWIAARAKVGDYRFFRVDESDRAWRRADCMGRVFTFRYSWSDVCSLGPVTVIPDQGWTVSDDGGDNQEVPERIETWPEDDTALRKYTWVSTINVRWTYLSDQMSWGFFDERSSRITPWGLKRPLNGPWTRVDDA